MLWPLSFVLVLCIFRSATCQDDCDANQDLPWSYQGANGPEHWSDNYPVCAGRNQSPININTGDGSTESTNVQELSTFGYEQSIEGELENRGYTVEVIPKDNKERGIQIGDQKYNLQQFHMHFGARADNGTEHRFNNRGYAMEMHLVHKSANGELAVIGILFQEGTKDNADMKPITKKLSDVKYKDQQTKVSDIELLKIIPKCSQPNYYHYSGSLTTPNCAEGAKWFVLSNLQSISKGQMNQFRRVYSTKEDQGKCLMAGNFRPVQPLNGRSITANTGQCLGSR